MNVTSTIVFEDTYILAYRTGMAHESNGVFLYGWLLGTRQTKDTQWPSRGAKLSAGVTNKSARTPKRHNIVCVKRFKGQRSLKRIHNGLSPSMKVTAVRRTSPQTYWKALRVVFVNVFTGRRCTVFRNADARQAFQAAFGSVPVIHCPLGGRASTRKNDE